MRVLSPFRGVSLPTLREAATTFRPALAGQGWPLARIGGATLVMVILEVARPWPIKLVLDRILTTGARPLWGLSTDGTLAVAVTATLLIPLLIGELTMRSAIGSAEVGRKVTQRVRRKVFEHLHRLDLPYHQASRSGDLLVRLMGDVNMVRDLLFASWLGLAERVILFTATAGVMLLLDPVLALVALAPIPLLALGLGRSSVRLKEMTRKQRRREGDAASFAAETLRQIRVVKAYAGERRATDQFSDEARSGERAGVKAVRVAARMARLSEALTGLGLAMVLLFGARRVMGGNGTAGDLVVFMSYARALYKPVRKVTGEGARLSKATACAERLLDVLRIPAEGGEGNRAPRFRGDVTVTDVSLAYPGGRQALDGLSFEVSAGQMVVVTGANGSGKSSLLAVLLRLLVPDQGVVLVDGQPVTDLELSSYRSRIAYVPQDIQLFGASIRDNVLYGRPDATDEDLRAAITAAILDEVVDALPDGIDTVLSEAGGSLSGGQGRRLMLARAAVRDASILLLDEPFAGIDAPSRPLVAETIRRISRGRTTFVVSHDTPDELCPDVVLRLEHGRLAGREGRSARRVVGRAR